MMRALGIVLNLALIGVLIFLIADSGMPTRGGQIALVLLLVVTPLLNLVFLLSRAGNSNDKGLLSLYLQRKALEERKKIAELEK